MRDPADLGPIGEDLAVDFLRLKGYTILARNYRAGRREIDVVASTGGTLVFVEVKSRWGDMYGLPQEAVNEKKQRRITKAAMDYVRKADPPLGQIRFDVIAVRMGEDGRALTLEHIPNAFPAPRKYLL
jgi:putative endonuclease